MSDVVDWSSPASTGDNNSGDSNSHIEAKEPSTKEVSGEETSGERAVSGQSGGEPDVQPTNKATPSSDGPNNDGLQTESGKSKDVPKTTEGNEKKRSPRMVEIDGVIYPESELKAKLGQVQGANQKFKEIAEARKQMEEFKRKLLEDPISILSNENIKIDRQALAEKWLLEKLEQENSDPRDLKIREYEERERQLQREQEQLKERHAREEHERVVESKRQEIAETIAKAMENTVLSKNDVIKSQVVREMASYMRAASEQGIDVTPDQLVEHVEHSRYAGYHALANGMEGEDLISFLGESVVNKIRKADLKRIKAKQKAANPKQVSQPSSKPKSKESKFVDPYDSLRSLDI